MQLNLTETNVRNMAARLRATVGASVLPLGESLEAVSQTLGYPNWDTLSGLLKKKKPATKFLVLKATTLYVAAHATDEFGDKPAWAKVALNSEFVSKLLSLQGMCTEYGLRAITVSRGPLAWGGGNAKSMGFYGDELYVDSTGWWFRAQPRHRDYFVESQMMDVSCLFSTPKSGSSDEFLLCAKDVLVYAVGGSAPALLEDLVSDGELDESYLPD